MKIDNKMSGFNDKGKFCVRGKKAVWKKGFERLNTYVCRIFSANYKQAKKHWFSISCDFFRG